MSEKALVVTGMHRAHTSSFAESLFNAGLFIGDDLYQATKYNARGHFESKQIVAFHNQLLDENKARSWFELINKKSLEERLDPTTFQASANQLIALHFDREEYGWKDPRAAFFLTYWDDVLAESYYIFVFRDPILTVQSLIRRNLKDSTLKFRPLLATRYFNLWDATYRSILAFYKKNEDRSLLIHAPKIFTSSSSLAHLNETVLGKWNFNLEEINFSHFDPNLISSKEPSVYLKSLLKARKGTSKIYNQLIQLSVRAFI